MNLNEECLLHYLGHFKNTTQPPMPAPALKQPLKSGASTQPVQTKTQGKPRKAPSRAFTP